VIDAGCGAGLTGAAAPPVAPGKAEREDCPADHRVALGHMEIPEASRELPDVTIRVRETSPGFFEASFRPTSTTHIARNGFTVDTTAGARGRTLNDVLAWAEGHWRTNYPLNPDGTF
jgi:hypothetical protein